MPARCPAAPLALSLLRRTTARTQRPLLLPKGYQSLRTTTRPPFLAASETSPASMESRREIHNESNSDSGNSPRRPDFRRPTLRTLASLGRARAMVTVTQTNSSERDDALNSAPPHVVVAPGEGSAEGGGLAITGSCAARIRQLASSRPNPDAVYLRLYVDAGGCSGFQYKFLLLSEDDGSGDAGEDEEDGAIDPEEDIVFERDGTRVVIDRTSLDLLRGSTVDYVQEMIRSSFAVVGNPQSESACGCGSSFAVKNFEANPAFD